MIIKNRKNRIISFVMSCVMLLSCLAVIPFSALAESGNETHNDFSGTAPFKFNQDVPNYAIKEVDGNKVFDLNDVTYDGQDGTSHNKKLQYAYTGIKEGTRPEKVAFRLYVNKYKNNGLMFMPFSRFNLTDENSNFAPYIIISCDKYESTLTVGSDSTWNTYKDSTFDGGYFGPGKFDIASTKIADMLDSWVNVVCEYDWSDYTAESGYKVSLNFSLVGDDGYKLFSKKFDVKKQASIPAIEDFTFAISEAQSTDHAKEVLIDELYVWSETVDGSKKYEPQNVPEYLIDKTAVDNKTYSNFSGNVPFSFSGDVPNYALKMFENRKVFDLNDVTYLGKDSDSHNKRLQYAYTGLAEDSRPTKVELTYYYTDPANKSSGFFFFPFSAFSLRGPDSNYSPYISIGGDNKNNLVLSSDSTWNGVGLGKYFDVQKFDFAANKVTCDVNSWVTLRCEYDWSKYNEENGYVIGVTVKTLKQTGEIINNVSFEIKKAASAVLADGFTFAVTERQGTNHDVPVYFRDLQVWSEKSDGSKQFAPQSKDKQFKETFKDLLKKTVSDITLSDEDEVTNAVSIFNELNAEEKSALSKEKALIDSFYEKIFSLSEDKQEQQTEDFRTKYSRILALTTATVKTEDETEIKAALAEYDTLYSATQSNLSEEKALLDSLLIKISELKIQEELGIDSPTISQGYSSDFETEGSEKVWGKDHLQLYADPSTKNVPLGNGGIALDIDRAADPMNAQNHVLKVTGTWGLAVPYSFALPEHSALTNASFKVTTLDETRGWNGALRLIPAYLDENNYSYVEFTNTNDGWQYRGGGIINGITTGIVRGVLEKDIDLLQGFTVDYVYDPKALTVYLTLTPNSATEKPFTCSLSYGSQKWSFALSAPYSPWGKRPDADKSIYYDDVKLEFQKGDWDDDIAIRKPVVYYTGNTVINPGDIAMISGENLGNTVKKIEVAQLPSDSSKMGYILQNKYDSTATESEFTSSVSPEDVYNSLTVKEQVNFSYKSSTAIEFIVPTTFSKGMYVAKLIPKYSSEEPAYVYINLPDVDYALGNEGEIATKGGTFRIVGKNISLFANNTDGYKTSSEVSALGVKAQLKAGKDATPIDCTISSVESPYSMTVKVPNNIELGKYELSIYNGAGGDSAWSRPITVTVGEDPRANRSDKVFNVVDFGADPAEVGNDTPAIIAALDAAAENGGGTVYIPSGVYGIRYSLPIPENVHLKGAGYERTSLVFNSMYYDFGEMPKSMFTIEGNAEISDLTYNAVRTPSVFYSDCEVHNVYIHDVRITSHPFQGTSTQGGGGQPWLESDELATLIKNENQKGKYRGYNFENTDSTNIQITDSTFKVPQLFWLVGGYNIVSDCKLYGDAGSADANQSKMLSDSSIFENNSRGDSATLSGAFEGNGLYIIGNEIGGTKTNNREIITTDGGMNYGVDLTGIIQKVDSDPTGLTYRFTTGHTYPLNRWKGSQIYVMQGQGAMQYRTIAYSSGDIIKVETPFVIEPNRNSRVATEDARADLIYYNNTASDGGMVGTYGTQCGAVYDSNTYFQCEANRMRAHMGAPVWFQSFNNNTYYDGNFWHVNADGDISSSVANYGGINISPTNYKNIISSMMIRNCNFSKNMMIHIAGTIAENIQNIVLDNNSFRDSNNGIRISSNNNNSIGVLMYRNTFDNVDYPILSRAGDQNPYTASDIQRITNTYNEFGYACLTILDGSTVDSTKPSLGDVSLNGSIELKDVTLIRYYLVGKIDLTSEMFTQADVNEDGIVDIEDATILRMYLLGKVTKLGKDWSLVGEDTDPDPDPNPDTGSGPITLPEDDLK